MDKSPQPAGCTFALLGINTVVIGFLAFAFAGGPYSSAGQMRWYRFGSLGLLVAGVIVPVVALALGARRSFYAMAAITALMFFALVASLIYALNSTGGA